MKKEKTFYLVNNTKLTKRGFNDLFYQLEIRYSTGGYLWEYPYKRTDKELCDLADKIANDFKGIQLTSKDIHNLDKYLKEKFLGIRKEVK